jgi:hypothetical protein
MKYYILIKADFDFADEFSCKSFGVFLKEDWEKLKVETKKVLDDFASKRKKHPEFGFYMGNGLEIYFGTNEYLQINDYADWIKNLSEIEITEAEYNFFRNNFGKTWGTGDSVFCVSDYAKERLEDDNEDED